MELTPACNNACEHCYNFWRYQETGAKLDRDDHSKGLEHFSRILDIIIEQGIVTVTFTGGEPFLRRDILFSLIAKAKKAGLKVLVNTNAALITRQDVTNLAQLGVEGVLVSLLSYDETTHNSIVHASSYGGTLRGIRRLIDGGVNTSINMVVSSLNATHVRSTAELVKSLGSTAFSATPVLSCHLSNRHNSLNLLPEQVRQAMSDLFWARDSLGMSIAVLEPLAHCLFSMKERRDFAAVIETRYCCAGISDAVVSPDGDLRPCILSTDIGGNILIDGWEGPWENLGHWKSQSMIPNECLSCGDVDKCGGGCRAAAKAHFGDYTAKDPYMTQPISAIQDDIKPQPSRKISTTSVLRPRPGLQTRMEPFGGIVFFDETYTFLRKEAFSFLMGLLDRKSFHVDKVAAEYSIPRKEARDFFQALVDDGYLVAKEGGTDGEEAA